MGKCRKTSETLRSHTGTCFYYMYSRTVTMMLRHVSPKKFLEIDRGYPMTGRSKTPKVTFKTSILVIFFVYELRHLLWKSKTFWNSVKHVYIDVSHREESIYTSFVSCTRVVGKLWIKNCVFRAKIWSNMLKFTNKSPIIGALNVVSAQL